MTQWHKKIPCPNGCGNVITYKGPNHTPAQCRVCYLAEIRENPDVRRRMVAQAEMARRARAEQKAREAAEQREINPMELPMGYLWFERDRVFDFIADEVGDTARMELSKDSRMAARWDTWRSRPWLRFDQVDEVLCVLGLWIGDLGEPVYSEAENKYPVLEAV